MPTSQIPLVWFTQQLARIFTGSKHYDIRYFGALNIAILASAMLAALLYLRDQKPLVLFLLPAFMIWILTDAVYVVYFNSFYADATSIGALLCIVAAACWLTRDRISPWAAAGFIGSVLLFTTSKSAHAPVALLAAGLALWFACRARGVAARAILISGAVATIAILPFMLRLPVFYRAFSLYNAVFYKLPLLSPSPATMLTELGLPASDARAFGKTAWDSDSLILSGESQVEFVRIVTPGKLVRYYLRHPKVALKVLNFDLRENANRMLVSSYGNYRREDGFPPGTVARHFHTWSSLRSWMLQRFPYHVVILYAAVLIAFWRKKLFPIALFLVVAGLVEFLPPTLADAIDTPRHLILFHLISDLIIIFLAGAGLAALQTRLPSVWAAIADGVRSESVAEEIRT